MYPYITIITACWRVDGVKRVIDCVNNQTHKEWQHILVNDNNPEVEEFFKENNYFKNSEQRHCVSFHIRTHFFGAFARNCGTMIAFSYFPERIKKETKDFWILYLDDDNLWLENHLEKFIESWKEKPNSSMIGWDMEIRSTINPEYKHNINCVLAPQQFDLGSFAIRQDMFDKYGYFPAGIGGEKRKITFDAALYNKIFKGEGEDKIFINHYRPCSFIFYSRERK